MEKILDMVNWNVQIHWRNFKIPKLNNMRWHKQIKEHREDLNKYQSEIKDTLKREIHELKKTTQIIKEELNKDMENLGRKKQTEIWK
jgi:gas vesicle protein